MNHDTLQSLMREATQLTRAGRLQEATTALQHALGAQTAWSRPDMTALLVPSVTVTAPIGVPPAARGGTAGDFVAASHTHAGLTRRYKLYSPPGPLRDGRALVVMLHGCTQDPDDFATGTRMNRLAASEDFYVLYPAQAQNANPAACWNWFKPNHQRRGSGEPAWVASTTQAVMKAHNIDPRRVYIAGLSAGGAMAAVVGRAYPDIFSAVGIHSGLPCGAAHDAVSALSVMKSGVTDLRRDKRTGVAGSAGAAETVEPSGHAFPSAPAPADPPTIVFHGDQDTTVHPRNAERIVADVMRGARGGAEGGMPDSMAAPQVEHGVSEGGRRYTRVFHRAGHGAPLVEHWLLHGAGHAWAGGDAAGSHTDPKGPDASREMWRFFSQHR